MTHDTSQQAVGVDWARGCWVVVAVDGDAVEITTEPAILNVWTEHGDADAVLVDVPIGLPDAPPRACDEAAAAFLGDRHSSVFAVPCRDAVETRDYDAARAANGGRLGSQSWGLVPRIREVDCFLREYPAAASTLYESHPEVCFAAFARRAGVDVDRLDSKQTAVGVEARLDLLEAVDATVGARVREFVDERRSDAAWHHRIQSGRIDDVLDAAVLALTAAGPLDVLPDDRDADDRPVIVYPAE